MSFDGTTICALVHELSAQLTEQRISKIAQPEKEELLLTVKGAKGQSRLLISANASLPFIYLTPDNKTSPKTAPNFCMLLRKHIQGGKISDITQIGYERVIRFTIQHLDELGDPAVKYLYIEIMGKHSNIIFTDSTDTILDAIKHVPFSMSSVREVLPGRTYFIPAQEDHVNPLEVTEPYFLDHILKKPTDITKALYTSMTGISPMMASEIAYRAGLDPSAPCDSLDDIGRLQLFGSFSKIMSDISAGRFTPCIVYDPKNDSPKEFSGIYLTSYENMRIETFGSMSEVLRTYYAKRNLHTNIHQKSANLRQVITTLLDRNRKKLAIQKKQMADTDKMDKYRIYGELLHTYGYQAKDGDKSLTCINYYDNQEITIPLDATLSAMENAEKYFNKYNKLKRTRSSLDVYIKETEDAIDHLTSMLTALSLASDQADLDEVHDELSDYGYIHKRVRKKGQDAKSKPLHYVTEDGYHIYVGKNNHQNDYLTFKLANGNDWWFHTKKIHGSHVIVQTKDGELPDHVFEIAAGLAAYYSQGRETDRVEVDYLQKKNVKRPAGGVPGFVVYYTNYSLVAHPSLEGVTEIK